MVGQLLPGPPPAGSQPLTVEVNGLSSNSAPVVVGFYNSAAAFPKPDQYRVRQVMKPAGATYVRVQAELAPGKWAIVVFQDLNGNGQLDTNGLGQPKEPYAFSNNYRPVLRGPHFEECVVPIAGLSGVVRIALLQP